MRTGSVCSTSVNENHCRLTGGFHLSENQLASVALEHWASRSDGLASLCQGGGLFRGPIFRRVFVDAGEGSRPYVSAKDLERVRVRPPNRLAAIQNRLNVEKYSRNRLPWQMRPVPLPVNPARVRFQRFYVQRCHTRNRSMNRPG